MRARRTFPEAPLDLGLRFTGLAIKDADRLRRWIFAEHQKLIGMRRRNAWLTHADVEVTDKTNETISLRAFGSGDDGEHSLTLDAWLDPAPGVRVHSEDGVEYEWLG